MRIIAGSAGGVPLKVPKLVTRPTSDRVREAVFSILGTRVAGACVLDLFAGSGALGIEALSRGAAAATFVDSSRSACETVRANLAKAKLAGASKVICADVFRSLDRLPPADLIFADPPYARGGGGGVGRDLAAELLGRAEPLGRLLRPGGRIVVETAAGATHGGAHPWEPLDHRTYGSTAIWIFGLPVS
ncbi:16S rRNA (guanine(966)-N(2))-methyltransferase RsmD [soil metagenome]